MNQIPKMIEMDIHLAAVLGVPLIIASILAYVAWYFTRGNKTTSKAEPS